MMRILKSVIKEGGASLGTKEFLLKSAAVDGIRLKLFILAVTFVYGVLGFHTKFCFYQTNLYHKFYF